MTTDAVSAKGSFDLISAIDAAEALINPGAEQGDFGSITVGHSHDENARGGFVRAFKRQPGIEPVIGRFSI